MKFIIIGGGVAGTTAAEYLRKLDTEAEITLVSEEHHSLYSRVLLPHLIKGKVPRERIFLKKDDWYYKQNIDVLRGVVVEKLDVKNKFVLLTGGRELEFDKLLIATGGEVRTIDDDLRGVSYFRTLDDADHISQLLNELPHGARGGIYGGGFIACEYLNLFRHFEMPTTIAFRGKHFWSRVLEVEAGTLINDHLVKEGVEVHVSADLVSLTGETQLEGFVTTAGEHPCSMLGVGIGVTPDFSYLSEAGVETGNGVKANEYLETNIENIFTAGDVAEFYDSIAGRHLNVKNWMNAMSQGRAVAQNMAGTKTPFELVSSYSINRLGLEMIFVGDVDKDAVDKVHVIGSADAGGVTQVYERDGKVVGGVMIGRNTDRKPITDGIKEKRSAEEVIKSVNN